MTTARVPCEAIKRYPVVARWRNDVDYVAAGIYCFQPYCVTGELDPPANPLICPQFCVRFNDLDNIGLTGRHYSGFIMMGIQVFNYPDKYVFFKDECVEFNYRWLTEELGIEPDEITFIEDVWAGGGNLGPSIEYFVRGLEVGNMVFMQYKTFHDGSREELQIKIIDTGIGLERIAWLYNGTPTSYVDTFHNALSYLTGKLEVEIKSDIWEKFGPYSSQLNIDEVDDIEATWARVSKEIDIEVDTLKAAITQAKDVYIILDHTRSVLMTVTDGSLPANVGGGGNVRNILRRVFSILEKNGWWKKLSMDDFLVIFQEHKKDLEGIIGAFAEYKSFDEIIRVELERWKSTDEVQKKNLDKLLKQRKNGKLTIDDWIIAMQSWGIPADRISELSKDPVPGNLYYEIAQRQERVAKAPETILYSTYHLQETDNLYYQDHSLTSHDAKVVDVFANVLESGKRNILIVDRSAVYPTSGGQQHDTAVIKIEGIEEPFKMINAEKVGKVVLHILDRELPTAEELKGKSVHIEIDSDRRSQLMAHHTGTHIVFASCRKVLGPHVWQNGAKKTVESAHLDITHYKGITKEEERAIENEANRIINSCHKISKSFMNKADAEKQFGFNLYQGGIVPGNSLRVVNIEGVDTEACCGTHCDNTAEVGWIRIVKSQRISDGIVRLNYVAQERAIQVLNEEQEILQKLCDQWGVDLSQIVSTASRFFKEYKNLSATTKKQDQQILNLQVKFAIKDQDHPVHFVRSEQPDPTIYFSFLPQFAEQLQKLGKGLIFVGDTFVVGLLGTPDLITVPDIEALCKTSSTKEVKARTNDTVKFDFKEKGKKPVVTKGVCQFSITGQDFNITHISDLLKTKGAFELD